METNMSMLVFWVERRVNLLVDTNVLEEERSFILRV